MKKLVTRVALPLFMLVLGVVSLFGGAVTPGPVEVDIVNQLLEAPEFGETLEKFLLLVYPEWKPGLEVMVEICVDPRCWRDYQRLFTPEAWWGLPSAEELIRLLTGGGGFYIPPGQPLGRHLRLVRPWNWDFGDPPPEAPEVPPMVDGPDDGDEGGQPQVPTWPRPRRAWRQTNPWEWLEFAFLPESRPLLAIGFAIVMLVLGFAAFRWAQAS